MSTALAVRIRQDNPNHHLWDNNGTWFIHYTLHGSDFTKSRIRRSLGTKSLATARKLRDCVINSFKGASVSMQRRAV